MLAFLSPYDEPAVLARADDVVAYLIVAERIDRAGRKAKAQPS